MGLASAPKTVRHVSWLVAACLDVEISRKNQPRKQRTAVAGSAICVFRSDGPSVRLLHQKRAADQKKGRTNYKKVLPHFLFSLLNERNPCSPQDVGPP